MTPQFEKYFNIVASCLAILGFIITLWVLPEEYKFIGYYTSAVLFVIAVFALGFLLGRRTSKLYVSNYTEQNFIENLLIYFEKKKKENANEEIIRLGIALSTPLWLSQNYETRKIIGGYVYDAAINAENPNAQIKVLIDDLGWTNVELGLYDDAKEKLLLGIKLADEEKNGYYLSKGYRHLFGINYRNGNIEKAEEYLMLAIKHTELLHQDKKKDELIAEIHFAKSSLEYRKGNYEVSLSEIEAAAEEYKKIPDKEWAIKISARRGDILLEKGEAEEAIKVFKHGLHDAMKFHFNKQIVTNMIGIGKCQYKSGDYIDSRETFTNAYAIADKIGMFYEKYLINVEFEKLKSKIKSS